MDGISEGLKDVLIDTGNRALNDFYHERACSCDSWPAKCVTPRMFFGMYDTDAFAIGVEAIIARYEELKGRTNVKESTVFEIGKTYRIKEAAYQEQLATVVSVGKTLAIGWWWDGDIWYRPHTNRDEWEEVGLTFSSEERKNLKAMGIDLGVSS